MSSTSPDFDWYDDDAESVVVPEQAAIAVYLNPTGDVVIRQAGHYGPDEDMWIVVAPDRAPAVADAILRIAGLAVYAPDDGATTAPKDRTAADRQRRYRERNRNGTDRDVTGRDGDLPLLLERSSDECGGA